MKFCSSSFEMSRLQEVGGKGLHLQRLVSWGAPVAHFIVINTSGFSYYRQHGVLHPDLIVTVNDFLTRHPVVALRSSMIGEDQANASFAGLFETILNVTAQNWQESLFKIYSSVDAPRVKEYLEKKRIAIDLKMAVVVQQQINVEKSGVLFTRSPVEPTAAVAIDAAFGMGEGVVSGHASVDNYLYTRNGDQILHISNNEKSILSVNEIKELIGESLRLEEKAGYPSDIEWGFLENKLYIFQIRPITQDFSPLACFVDTNLSESYPGVVSPFTAEFVKKAYANVFTENAEILGAADERLKILRWHYEKLITAVDNHLYYNLEHYYAALRALPGGDKNIESWHRMIGGKLEGIKIPHHDTSLSKWETIKTMISLLRIGINHQKVFAPFLRKLESEQEKILKDQSLLKTPEEIIDYLATLVEKPLGFGLTVLNDIYVMMGLAFLTKAVRKRGFADDRVLELLKTSEQVDSLKPLEAFNGLLNHLSKDFIERLQKKNLIIGLRPYERAFSELESEGFGTEVSLIRGFLLQYGDRSFEELKLESLPLKNNPQLLLGLLKWSRDNTPHAITHKEVALDLKLSWFELKLLRFTREAIAMREATRLWRGRYYHLLRSLVLNLAEKLQGQQEWQEFGLLDFFSLKHQEWKRWRNGELNLEEVRQLILSRRDWQSQKTTFPECIVWTEGEKLPRLAIAEGSGEITGQGVSPGIVEGVALVLEQPQDAFDSELNDFILVTKNTDPAWVYIMSRSKGLISEKGSLLSHTAIIGRELNIPTIVGVKGATTRIKNHDRLRIDAAAGKVEIL